MSSPAINVYLEECVRNCSVRILVYCLFLLLNVSVILWLFLKTNPNHYSLIRNISSRSSEFMNNPKITNKCNHSSRRKCFGKETGFRSNNSKSIVNSGSLDCTCVQLWKAVVPWCFPFQATVHKQLCYHCWGFPGFPGCFLPFFKIVPAFSLSNSSSI